MYKVVIQSLICLNKILQKLVKYVFWPVLEKFGLCVEVGFSQIGSQISCELLTKFSSNFLWEVMYIEGMKYVNLVKNQSSSYKDMRS